MRIPWAAGRGAHGCTVLATPLSVALLIFILGDGLLIYILLYTALLAERNYYQSLSRWAVAQLQRWTAAPVTTPIDVYGHIRFCALTRGAIFYTAGRLRLCHRHYNRIQMICFEAPNNEEVRKVSVAESLPGSTRKLRRRSVMRFISVSGWIVYTAEHYHHYNGHASDK